MLLRLHIAQPSYSFFTLPLQIIFTSFEHSDDVITSLIYKLVLAFQDPGQPIIQYLAEYIMSLNE